MGHAKFFPPSSLSRRGKCPASVLMESTVNNYSTEYADNGSGVHLLSEEALKKGASVSEALGTADSAALTMQYTNEDIEAAQHYVTVCNSLSTPFSFIEKKVSYREFVINKLPEEESQWATDNLPLDFFGTLDFAAIDYDNGVLLLPDYKNGTVPVYAKNNWQLTAYTMGLMGSALWEDSITQLKLAIVQPNAVGKLSSVVDYWELSAEQLAVFIDEDIIPSITECIRILMEGSFTEDQLVPGESQCQFCDAKATCKARMASALPANYREVNASLVPKAMRVLPEAASLTHAQLEQVLLIEKDLSYWLKQVRAYAQNEALEGVEFEGQKLVQNLGRRKYTDETAAERALGRLKLTAKERREPTKLRSPAQISKLLDGGYDHPFFKKYVERPLGAPKLVPESAKGKPMELVQKEQAEEAFSDID